jgi:hypothetical protein
MKPRTAFYLAAAMLFAPVFPTRGAPSSDRLLPEDYVNLLRIDLRASKAEVVAESLELTEAELAKFWPLYREYDERMSKLNVRRINVLRDFTENYASIDERKAREITRANFEFQRRRLTLLEKYSDKIARATSPLIAARFVQIESHLQLIVDVQLASDLPLIPREVIISRLQGGG